MISCKVNYFLALLYVLFAYVFYLALSQQPVSKEEHLNRFKKVEENLEPFQRNISECARQVKASMSDVDNFLKRIPQQTMEGKCFVACILRRNSVIKNNKIVGENLLALNRAAYGENSEIIPRMAQAIKECEKIIESIFEICEYASVFNDCMHMKLEHIVEKVTMDQRMEALNQISTDPDVWDEEDEEILALVRDEL